jgi:predicted AAA+ superfamily ATPase
MKNTNFTRWLTPALHDALTAAPAVFVNGPRQAGKSTLVKQLTKESKKVSYVTLDDLSVCSAAQSDPAAFLQQFDSTVIIDEAQMAPALFRAIKQVIDELREKDRNKVKGRFILTGSANILALPQLADALVGRMRILTLLPMGMGEYADKKPVIQKLSEQGLSFFTANQTHDLFHLEEWIHRSSFPEIALIPEKLREEWYRDYLATILQRDVQQLADIDKIAAIPHLLKILSLRTASLINDSAAARDAGLNTMTYRRYRMLLQHVFLITTIPPWFKNNIGKRLTKSPKLFFYDTGLLAYLYGADLKQLKTSQSPLYGPLVENFVASELMKQLTVSPKLSLYHYRTEDGREVDFVLENAEGKLIGLEVKARQTVNINDFAGLKSLKESAGKDFKCGILLYAGKNVLGFGQDMLAVPITALMM